MFENLIKIVKSGSELKEKTVVESLSLQFLTVKDVTRKDLPTFLKELEVLNGRLDDAMSQLYRDEKVFLLQNQCQELIKDLALKQNRLSYLSSFFESTTQKILAAKKGIEDYESKLEEAEEKKEKIDENLQRLRERLRKRKRHSSSSKLVARRPRNRALTTLPLTRSWTIPYSRVFGPNRLPAESLRGDVELNLQPTTPEGSQAQSEDFDNNLDELDDFREILSQQEEQEELPGTVDDDWFDVDEEDEVDEI